MVKRRDFIRLASLAAAWPAAAWGQGKARPKPQGVVVNDVHAQLSSALVYRIVQPESLDAVRSAIRLAQREKRPVSFSGSRHSTGGQGFIADGVMIDSRKLARVLAFDAERGLIEAEAGIQWPQLFEYLRTAQLGREQRWAFAQKQADADRLTLGGSLAANIHGRGLALPPMVHDIEAFKLLNARGQLLQCSRTENEELFRLAIGGYGLFGFVYSITLRLVPRRMLERVVELRGVEGLREAFAERVRDGHLYGEFLYAIDDQSEDFMRRGVFCTYRPAPHDQPVQGLRRDLTDSDVTDLLHLAHVDKADAFQRLASHYQSTAGQLYWSDELQMSPYPESYHREIDRRVQSPTKGTEALTEIFCERDALEHFMAEARDYARRNKVEFIHGAIRVVEQDQESYLAWARKPYAGVSFNLHIEHTTSGMIRAGDALRRLIDMGIRHGGSYHLAYHRYALRHQVLACFPQLPDFLRLKRKYDPSELFQSEWYRHYKRMFES